MHSDRFSFPDKMESVSVSIGAGKSLSGSVNLGGAYLLAIKMPTSWTDADLSFQASEDELSFADLYSVSGAELIVPVSGSRYVLLPVLDLLGVQTIKVRSGRTGAPVNQASDRTLKLVVLGR